MANHNNQFESSGEIFCREEGGDKPRDQYDEELGAEMVKRAAKANNTALSLVDRLKAAREFMAWSASHLRGTWLDWQEACDKAVHDLNQDRMAFDREGKAIIAAAKDVRDLFNSVDYCTAHNRLKEMVELLERFTQLKKDGTLDAFAEFILKVTP